MSEHTWAWVSIGLYALLVYASVLIRPRKCSEHEKPETRIKYLMWAPFNTVILTGAFLWVVSRIVLLMR